MRPKVLVTAIGTAASTAIITQLKKSGNYYIVGGDIYKKNQVATALDVDEFYTFPLAIRELDAYIDFAVYFCKRHGIQYYFATIDEEIANLSQNRGKFEAVGVSLCIPNHKLVMTCHYKDTFSEWIETNMPEIFIKRYKSFSDVEDKDFPLFVKPIEGRASIGCRKIENKKAMEKFIGEGIQESNFVIQKYTDGEIITVDLIRNAEFGHARQVQRIEKLRNPSGCGIAVEVIAEPHLTEICNQLMEKLDLNGVVNAEFFRNGSQYKIIEINPRFSAGTSFSCIAGCDTVIAALNIASGDDFTLGEPVIGMHLAKKYETYRMD